MEDSEERGGASDRLDAGSAQARGDRDVAAGGAEGDRPAAGGEPEAVGALAQGQVTAYALESAQNRGRLMVQPGDEVYEGQVLITLRTISSPFWLGFLFIHMSERSIVSHVCF